MSDKPQSRLPEWATGGKEPGFASRVMDGVTTQHDGLPGPRAEPLPPPAGLPPRLTVADYYEGIRQGNRGILARSITLVESNLPRHGEVAQQLLQSLLPHAGNAVRVGITGVPGAGKSTFIEGLGCRLCQQGHKVAVLAVDPSSTVTKGSILGDKTRMEQLNRHPNAFIRPSPSGGTLGGVARKSRETMILCEAAGYDIILVETVGVGQSEVTVRSMVDCFLLLALTGAGDELQGMKKGVMELADFIVVNKADGDNRVRALTVRGEYEQILHYLRPATEGWVTQALTCSALYGDGIPELWSKVGQFITHTQTSGAFTTRRQHQALAWLRTMVEEHLYRRFYEHPAVLAQLPRIEQGVAGGELMATKAVTELLAVYEGGQ